MDSFKVNTKTNEEVIDITPQIENIIKNKKGNACLVYSKHATSAIIINEGGDSRVCDDILYSLNELIPRNNGWKHKCNRNNAHAHIKSSFLGPSKIIPIKGDKLRLGRWQRVLFVELDGPRSRRVAVEVL